jgi:twitching motility protein PilT
MKTISANEGWSALEALFARCEALGASDVHLAAGQPPWMRVRGRLAPEGAPALDAAAVEGIAVALGATTLPPGAAEDAAARRGAVLARLAERGAIDGACSSAAGARYRFNVFREGGRCAVALRRLDDVFRPLADLGLPEKLGDFCDCPDGLVVVTGPTGSGKSTTLATLLDRVNRTREGHVVTIEDPVEYLHASRKCLVSQRQVGRDATGFNAALVEALREDPDVILVGEIRELETIRTAITAAETGHLVFTTLHAGDCAGAVERLVSVFPAAEQDGIRHQLAMTLRGIFAQHLLPTADGARRVPACELLVATPAIANLVATGRGNQIRSAIETGSAYGMFTLEQSLAGLVASGTVSPAAARGLTRSPDSLERRLARAGATGAPGADGIAGVAGTEGPRHG